MVDWYYTFSILPLEVYPLPETIYNVGADYDFAICAKTEDEIFKRARKHAKKEHRMKEIPKELYDKARSAIREVERC